jgi:hypothetical protein
VLQVPAPVAEQVTPTDPTVGGTTSAIDAVPGPVPSLVTVIVYVIAWPTIYDELFADFVSVKWGLAPALIVGVEAGPPPHCVEQPGVVGVMVAVLVTTPTLVTAPVTV